MDIARSHWSETRPTVSLRSPTARLACRKLRKPTEACGAGGTSRLPPPGARTSQLTPWGPCRGQGTVTRKPGRHSLNALPESPKRGNQGNGPKPRRIAALLPPCCTHTWNPFWKPEGDHNDNHGQVRALKRGPTGQSVRSRNRPAWGSGRSSRPPRGGVSIAGTGDTGPVGPSRARRPHPQLPGGGCSLNLIVYYNILCDHPSLGWVALPPN